MMIDNGVPLYAGKLQAEANHYNELQATNTALGRYLRGNNDRRPSLTE